MDEVTPKRRGRPPKNAAKAEYQEIPIISEGRRRKRDHSHSLSWEDAIEQVLRDSPSAMRYTDIANEISSRGLKSVANPAASVATAFSKSKSDPNSRFLPLGGGLYALKEKLSSENKEPEAFVVEEESEAGALRALGMFWQRDGVIWSGRPKLFGRQGEGASSVDFSEQVGVYLLHDRDRVIYVGRAADTLCARLKAHTTDRLSGRWDRFSWFGLRAVAEDGTLSAPADAWSHAVVIGTLEALLIESLEPPLNRRRGDNFTGVEYLQVLDPEIEDRRMRQVLDDLMQRRK